jgi:hypothetical protein
MKKWRRDHPNDTVKGLRKEIERLKREVVYARDEGRDEMADFVDSFLEQFEGSCRYRDGNAKIELGGKKSERVFQ